MWAEVRIWLKVVLGFLFSVTIILSSFTFALFGTREHDYVELIITEATGVEARLVVFSGQIQPYIIHNMFWLSLAALGFFLIFLYFIDQSFRVFLAPGVLCLVLFLFMNIFLFIAQSYITGYTGADAAEYVLQSMIRVRQASFAVLALGVLLIAGAHLDTIRKKVAG